MNKKIKSIILLFIMVMVTVTLVSCKPKDTGEVQKIIEQAQKMDRNELYAKAIEELDGKTMTAVGNSSRGKTAQEYFLAYLQGKKFDSATGTYVADAKIREEFPQYKEDFNGKIDWTQPKNNRIFAQISSDVNSSKPLISMTLIQDGNQIKSKMLDTGYLLNYIPKEWGGDKATNGEPFALQSLNKVFMYNNLGGKSIKNVWQFVAEGERPMFMGLDSEPVGKNFLYMLTNEKNSNIMKEAYDALTATEKTYFDKTIKEVEQDAKDLGLTHANAKYSLAWIKLWVKQFNQQTDDGPIMGELAKSSSVGESGLIVYSKLRSVNETPEVSKNNVTVAAYQEGYVGIGGFMYKHYLQVLKTSPFPWTSVAFIHFMTTTQDGFSPWGKDIGGYASDDKANQVHLYDGHEDRDKNKPILFPALNDRGYEWWSGDTAGKGRLVIEDPTYVASVSHIVGDWIDLL